MKISKLLTVNEALVKYDCVNEEDGILERVCYFRTPIGYDFTKFVIRNELEVPGKVVEINFFLKLNQYVHQSQEEDKSIKYLYYRVPNNFHIFDISNGQINFPQIPYKEACPKSYIGTQGQHFVRLGKGQRVVGPDKETVFLKPNEYLSCSNKDNKLDNTYYRVGKNFNIHDCFEGKCFVWPRNKMKLTYEEAHATQGKRFIRLGKGQRLVGLGKETVFLKPNEYLSFSSKDNELETTYFRVGENFNLDDCFEGKCFVWPRNMIKLTCEEAHTSSLPYDTQTT